MEKKKKPLFRWDCMVKKKKRKPRKTIVSNADANQDTAFTMFKDVAVDTNYCTFLLILMI